MKQNYQLKEKARKALKNSWLNSVLIIIIFGVITSIISFVIPFVGVLVISGPLFLGLTAFFMQLVRKKKTDIKLLFSGFEKFLDSFLLELIKNIFIMLWSLLFIIPGIIASFSYSMAYYIMKDNPKLSATECIRKSKFLMYGKKGKLFGLYFSFIGWWFLSIITFGIGFIFLAPYIKAAEAEFYEDIKSEVKKIK